MWDLWMSHREKLVKSLAGILDRGKGENRIRHDVPTVVLADFLLGMLRTRTRYLAGVEDAIRRLEVLLDIFLFGASGRSIDLTKGID